MSIIRVHKSKLYQSLLGSCFDRKESCLSSRSKVSFAWAKARYSTLELFKVDFENTYDLVSGRFLNYILVKFVIGQIFWHVSWYLIWRIWRSSCFFHQKGVGFLAYVLLLICVNGSHLYVLNFMFSLTSLWISCEGVIHILYLIYSQHDRKAG